MAAGNELKATLIVDASSVPAILDKVVNSVNKTENALRKVGPVSNSATMALINVGRVAQDLPFGILGIANNLNPLLESMQRTVKETGSVTAAFSAMGKSLIGGGGIGLALSVVSSLLIVFGDKLFGSKQKVDENKAALEALDAELAEAKRAMDEFIRSTGFLTQLGKIDIHVKFGEGLGATILAGQQGFVLLQQEADKLNDRLKELVKQKQDLFDKGIISGDFQSDKSDKIFKEIQAQEKLIKANSEKQQLAARELEDVKVTAGRDAIKKIDDAREAAHKKELARLAAIAEIMEELRRKELSFINKRRDAAQLLGIEEARKHVEEVGKQIPKRSEFVIRSNVTQELGFQFEKERLKQLKAYNDQLKEVARTISGVVTPAFDAMFDAIIAGENPLKAFFKGLIQGINDLIKKLIAAAIQALILKLITSASPAGVAGFIPGLGGLAKGLGGTANPGNFFSGGGRSINVVHSGNLVARGSDLVYVFDRTGRSQRRTG